MTSGPRASPVPSLAKNLANPDALDLVAECKAVSPVLSRVVRQARELWQQADRESYNTPIIYGII